MAPPWEGVGGVKMAVVVVVVVIIQELALSGQRARVWQDTAVRGGSLRVNKYPSDGVEELLHIYSNYVMF